MPKLRALAKAIKLAMRVDAEVFRVDATQELLYNQPLVMRLTDYMRLASRYAASTLTQRSVATQLIHDVASVTLGARPSYDYEPLEMTPISQINMAMVGDFMVG